MGTAGPSDKPYVEFSISFWILEGELEAEQKDGNIPGGDDESESPSSQSSSRSQSSGSPSGSDLEDDEVEEKVSSSSDPSEYAD